MSFDNRNIWLTYNGEIYNYIEIKEELKSFGYSFNSDTDTEVVLAAYHKWGKECIRKFNGMWAFAIYDLRIDEIFCSCDQQGIKPFYYFLNNNYFCFASEIKQLLEIPFVNRKVNNEYILNNMGFGISEHKTEITLFENIKKLKTGYNILIKNVKSDNPHLDIYQWHEFDFFSEKKNISEKNAMEEFGELFYDSVKLRLRSDVPVGTALSGGLDSSSIVMTIDKILKAKGVNELQKTFTIGSELSEYDETEYAKEVINNTNSKGFFRTPDADGFIKNFNKICYHIELPYISSSCYAIWATYELARENDITVTLDGQGADEIMGGYDYFHTTHLLNEFLNTGKFGKLINEITCSARIFDKNKKKIVYDLIRTRLKNIQYYYYCYQKNRINNSKLLRQEYKDIALMILKNSFEKNQDEFVKTKYTFKNNLKNYFYTISLPQILMTVDRISMAHSIEARLPYLDFRLIEFINSLPTDFKVRQAITKYIARLFFKGKLPDSIIKRKKLGFVTSEILWFNKKNKIINKMISGNLNRISDIFVLEEVRKLFYNNNIASSKNKHYWNIFSLSTLFNIFDLKV
jgi:asparagine synthase (glutamine-hydrolysing)